MNQTTHHESGVPDVFGPAKLGPLTLRNRTIKAATYEGLSRRGLVTDDLIGFHVRHAAGGVGITTLAHCAVAPEGRTHTRQILWRPEALPGLRKLTDAVHAQGAAACAQLGHAGPVADPRGNRARGLAPSRRFAMGSLGWTRAATSEDLVRVISAYADATRMAIDAGFDAVEVHLGHNYLPSSFLSPNLNRRKDSYGGSLENRARLAREISRAVRDAAGSRIAITAKLNMDDGVPGGLQLDEACTVARWLEADGSVDALEPTAGSSLLNPMYLFKGDAPVAEFAAVMPAPVRLGMKVAGRRFLRSYPYQDAYLLPGAREIRAAVKCPVILLGGITTRATMNLAMREGFQFVAMARALLREPDLINRIRADGTTPSLCIHCNKCVPSVYRGTHCVIALSRCSPAPSSG